MKITINPVLDMETLQWVSNDRTYDYDGPVIYFGGPSKQAKANEQAQTDFYKQQTKNSETVFQGNNAVLNDIRAITVPILAAGPDQYGFSPEVDALLKSQISDATARGGANALNATLLAEKQKTGGTDLLGAGGSAQLEENARILSEQNKASLLSQEKLEGYQAGREKWNTSINALSSSAGALQNPASTFAGAATGAGGAATSAINLADSERSNLMGTLLGGALGAAGAAFGGPIGGAIGSKIGGAIGGKGGGGFNPSICYIAARILGEDFETGPTVKVIRSLVANHEPVPVIQDLSNAYKFITSAKLADIYVSKMTAEEQERIRYELKTIAILAERGGFACLAA